MTYIAGSHAMTTISGQCCEVVILAVKPAGQTSSWSNRSIETYKVRPASELTSTRKYYVRTAAQLQPVS